MKQASPVNLQVDFWWLQRYKKPYF